jgi:hypothetical protein
MGRNGEGENPGLQYHPRWCSGTKKILFSFKKGKEKFLGVAKAK